MKICPYCAEEIQDAAIVCKHCGRDVVVAEPTEFDVVLTTIGPRDRNTLAKQLTHLPGWDAGRAGRAVVSPPSVILTGVEREVADAMVETITAAGGTAEVRVSVPIDPNRQRYACGKHGEVVPVPGMVKGASAGKITAGIFTGGLSILATGVRSKKGTDLLCPRCKKPVAELPR